MWNSKLLIRLALVGQRRWEVESEDLEVDDVVEALGNDIGTSLLS